MICLHSLLILRRCLFKQLLSHTPMVLEFLLQQSEKSFDGCVQLHERKRKILRCLLSWVRWLLKLVSIVHPPLSTIYLYCNIFALNMMLNQSFVSYCSSVNMNNDVTSLLNVHVQHFRFELGASQRFPKAHCQHIHFLIMYSTLCRYIFFFSNFS